MQGSLRSKNICIPLSLHMQNKTTTTIISYNNEKIIQNDWATWARIGTWIQECYQRSIATSPTFYCSVYYVHWWLVLYFITFIYYFQELCTHEWKWKNETCWNYSKNGERGIKESDGEVNLTKIYYKHFCQCNNVPQYNKNMIIKKKSSGSIQTIVLEQSEDV
jgi:hypothetical protein